MKEKRDDVMSNPQRIINSSELHLYCADMCYQSSRLTRTSVFPKMLKYPFKELRYAVNRTFEKQSHDKVFSNIWLFFLLRLLRSTVMPIFCSSVSTSLAQRQCFELVCVSVLQEQKQSTEDRTLKI